MLNFGEFFDSCTGVWKTERIYHSLQVGEIERSYTEFRVTLITQAQKQEILQQSVLKDFGADTTKLMEQQDTFPGFAIAFDTQSEKGETVSMSLQALFVPDTYIPKQANIDLLPPLTAQVDSEAEIIQGFYLRDQGYSEAGAIAGRFSYQPVRQTLEMTTYYRRSVAVDQMRLIAPDVRLRTIVTYHRPQPGEIPSTIDLIGFGVERRQSV